MMPVISFFPHKLGKASFLLKRAFAPQFGFDFHFRGVISNGKLLIGLDSYRMNVQQYNFNKDFRAKPVLSKAEGTPRPQRLINHR